MRYQIDERKVGTPKSCPELTAGVSTLSVIFATPCWTKACSGHGESVPRWITKDDGLHFGEARDNMTHIEATSQR
jgi:hypothetical protein